MKIQNCVIIKLKNKKAMVFTLLAIALIFLFLFSYSFYSIVQERKAVQKRIETLNNFVFSLEENLQRQMYVAGYRIIFLFEKKIIDEGDYVPDLDNNFNQAFFEGIVYGETSPHNLLEDVVFPAINESANEKASKLNAEVIMENEVLTVTQDDPWNVKFILTVDLTVKDKADLASWIKEKDIVAYIPIENFEDPTFVVETGHSVPGNIDKGPLPIDINNLQDYIDNHYYLASSISPSFLQRMEGKLDETSNYGIESLVNRGNPNYPNRDSEISSVDFIYFDNPQPSPTTYKITGMPAWFRLDDEGGRLDVYGVRDKVI